MLKLRSIGIRDYSVFEGGQRIAPGPTGDEIRIKGRPWRPFEPIARAYLARVALRQLFAGRAMIHRDGDEAAIADEVDENFQPGWHGTPR